LRAIGCALDIMSGLYYASTCFIWVSARISVDGRSCVGIFEDGLIAHKFEADRLGSHDDVWADLNVCEM